MNSNKASTSLDSEALKAADHIYHAWDAALANNDVEAFVKLYQPDAILESPVILHLLGSERGVCQGADEIRQLVTIVAQRKLDKRQYYRKKYFTDGKTLVWEYPGISPEGEQMDFVEVMELKDGLIQYHRVYWGWRGIDVIKKYEYHRS